MSIGKLEHRLAIQLETRVENGSGGFTSTWAAYVTRWSDARPVRGGEANVGGQEQSRQTYLFIVRQDKETAVLNAKDYRCVYDTTEFNILSVRKGMPDGGHQRAVMTIEAETQVGELS